MKTLRIIAGERRGHKIESPADETTRPTTDRVRESIFNILADVIEGRAAYDLFAGTGALGLEALSRGAARAVFVEKDRANLGLIRRNIAHLRYEDRSHAVGADVFRWVKSFDARAQGPVVVFLDPPYKEHERREAKLNELLTAVTNGLAEGSFLVFEAPERLNRELLSEGYEWDVRKYGGTCIAIGERTATEVQKAADPVEAISDADALESLEPVGDEP